ncbi:endonuclease V [Humisphaera borealis]|uniref:Endonuclease V n=1 Tax=Humisphaera borealis TaxID=2807512 RepID=A0A7M2WZZ4_9BACT|nr:endonuclease V [Humisphaera borealis]QOV90411.1 endonuclease V [Humisphaera borealis]
MEAGPSSKPRKVPPGLIEQWKACQAELRARLVIESLTEIPRFVAGADACFDEVGGRVIACALVWDRRERKVVDLAQSVRPLEFPYVPTFLSFREAPAVTEAIQRLSHPFGVVCFDGQGYAHPRRCGLATHVGVSLDVPAIGCAKSRLIGTHEEPGIEAGSSSPLTHAGEQIGLVLRTRSATKPIYASIGHRVDLASVRQVLLACCTRYRIPEPTRLADIEVAKMKKTLGFENSELGKSDPHPAP